ncbi:D-arabinose 1-dehydrogenase, Zn-dependent alcohol dehydrogenase family [Pseudomonas chlororaphis]|jgi:D-arabinose 1-dehydrogenase-like Zn-dependent alcohol dehydrogenase|uniref:alcohol dehydrogenase catalytic domain-containing protein n=1 Tax=Pseudomonas chlororaphis TaxID=587753 RepID=UPI0008649280|nr:alcohol dehydrogenase catalytic domain-containing protein [Pseudomonas chlororaphis]AZD67874.1 Alcohol dehydrogenase [Pseudomonas chlororaphis subsp. aurantiaca]AZD74092.1 Alcohol dehydrogenase [Pseudomonas chlororaphis subsp. aurantiaca]QIT23815.1 alcohol dehydrogenase catalytic domain-containing protein [Pseudomonas chlororaphis subsp. aurantiaca]WDH01916.1 alcohol dehydrogenase catalytic domain-containing protein [Pseudomonas chlororaphis]WDH09236.1 alcohol dehydrogenase catalytic domain
MKAIVLKAFGGPEQLQVQEVPTPQAGPGEVLVKVQAAGVCHHDLLHRAGRLPGAHTGVVLGHEVAGDVVEVGAGVSQLAVGARVVIYQRRFCGQCRDCLRGRQDLCRALGLPSVDTEGAYAQYLRVPAISAIELPDGLGYTQAALASCPIATSVRALYGEAALKPGETVLINGASGGLGGHQIQLARALGARVIAVTSSPEKRDFLQALGAHEVIVTSEGYSAQVWKLTGKRGVDVAMDNLGHTLEDTLRSMTLGGRVVVLGNVHPGSVPIAPGLLIGRRLKVQGSGSATLEELRMALALIHSGQVKPLIDRVLPFHEVARAHELLESRQVSGRIVLSGW